jgi:PAS domain S-box-containing protein
MIAAPIPADEAERQANLLSFGILDSERDPRVDAFVRVASSIFDVPVALVSLIDGDRQWFKAVVGADVQETPRCHAFCAHTILTPDNVFVVNDATADQRFSDNPFVVGGLKIRFYAGAPVISAEGKALGTLCIIDTRPRAFDDASKKQLADLALGVASAFELHRNTRWLAQAVGQRQHMEQMFDLMFGSVDAPAAIIGEDARISQANEAFHRMLGRPAGTLAGCEIASIVAPAFHEMLRAATLRQAMGNMDHEIRVELVHREGHEVPARLKSVAAQQPGGDACCIVTTCAEPEALAGNHPVAASPPGLRDKLAPHLQVAGSIQLVGLTQIRAALGPRWEQVAERAMQTAEHVIKRRIGGSDSWSRTADENFVICFASATEEEAAFRSAVIAREIRTRLLGQEDDPAMAQVTSVAAAVDIAPGPRGSGDIASQIQRRLDDKRLRLQDAARESLAALRAAPSWTAAPVHVAGSSRLFGHQLSVPSTVEQRMLSGLSALPGAETGGISVSAIVLEMLAKRPAALTGGMTVVNVDYEVFSSKAAEEHYLKLCAGLPAEFTQNLVMVLSKAPPNLPAHRLTSCLKRLRPFCYRVALGLTRAELPMVKIGEPLILTIPASRLLQRGAAQKPRLVRFLLSVAAHKALLLVTDVPDQQTASGLHAAGIRLISMRSEALAAT